MPMKWQRFKGEEKDRGEEKDTTIESKELKEDNSTRKRSVTINPNESKEDNSTTTRSVTVNPNESKHVGVMDAIDKQKEPSLFSRIDSNKDGHITRREFNAAVRQGVLQDASRASKAVSKDEEEFYRDLLAQHRDAIQQVLSENSERTLEAMIQQMETFQTKVSERQVESRAQVKMDDAPPQVQGFMLSGADSDSSAVKAEKDNGLRNGQLPSQNLAITEASNAAPPAEGTNIIGRSLLPLPHGRTKRSLSRLKFASRKSYRFGEQKEDAVQRGVFADAEAIKAKLRKEMSQPIYDVTNFYKTTGLAQNVARSNYVESCTLLVIAFNAVWIAVDVDLNEATLLVDASLTFQLVDNFFCLYFFVEWVVRYAAFAKKSDCLKDTWFVFDSIMCALMAMETWVVTFFVLIFSIQSSQGMGDASLLKGLRLVRLLRMARVMRLLRALPELMVVIKGMAVATRAVSCTVVLMLIIIYVFAVLFRQLTDGTAIGNKCFPSVPVTMRFLLLYGTVPDVEDVAVDIWNDNVLFALLFLFFILVITITVMNMLVGVLVGVVNTVAHVEKEQLTINFVKENLLTILRQVGNADKDKNGLISRSEFMELLKNTQAVRAFDMMGVDVVGLVDLGDFIFQEGKELSFADFMEVIMQLRGSNQATVKDIVDLRKFITLELKYIARLTKDGSKKVRQALESTSSPSSQMAHAASSAYDDDAPTHNVMPCLTLSMSPHSRLPRQNPTDQDGTQSTQGGPPASSNENSKEEISIEDDGKTKKKRTNRAKSKPG